MKKLLIITLICLSSVFVMAQSTDSLQIKRTPVAQVEAMADHKQATLVQSIEKNLDYIKSYVDQNKKVPQWPLRLSPEIGVLQRTGYDVKAYIKECQYYQKKVEQLTL